MNIKDMVKIKVILEEEIPHQSKISKNSPNYEKHLYHIIDRILEVLPSPEKIR